jgi:hypothetical protein
MKRRPFIATFILPISILSFSRKALSGWQTKTSRIIALRAHENVLRFNVIQLIFRTMPWASKILRSTNRSLFELNGTRPLFDPTTYLTEQPPKFAVDQPVVRITTSTSTGFP